MSTEGDRPGEIDAVGALLEPNRRALYRAIVERGDWMSRDDAAAATGLERATAAHHLDRLAADGLLEIEYQRPAGRTGPGAGRPSKLYRRADRDIAVSLPPRDYELAGHLLARAVERAMADRIAVDDAITLEAEREGVRLGARVRSLLDGVTDPDGEVRRAAVIDALSEHGFEPVVDDGTIVLRNCPFHRLAQEHTELVCGLNLCVLRSALDDVGATGLRAELEPEDGSCCVRLHAD
jgi:predicted ArsR family transcriptional regulator